jgi:hypothetical protein
MRPFLQYPCLEKGRVPGLALVVSAGAALGKTIAVYISAFFARPLGCFGMRNYPESQKYGLLAFCLSRLTEISLSV